MYHAFNMEESHILHCAYYVQHYNDDVLVFIRIYAPFSLFSAKHLVFCASISFICNIIIYAEWFFITCHDEA